jgi:hypothetical protein
VDSTVGIDGEESLIDELVAPVRGGSEIVGRLTVSA